MRLAKAELAPEVRDRLLELLLENGYDVHGDWNDYHVVPTDAGKREMFNEEIPPYERKPGWILKYRGDIAEWAEEFNEAGFCGRHPPSECGLPGTKIKPWHVEFYDQHARYSRTRPMGLEFDPPDQEERGIKPGEKRKVRVIQYKCEACGRIWEPARRYRHQMIHTADKGKIVLTKFELVEV